MWQWKQTMRMQFVFKFSAAGEFMDPISILVSICSSKIWYNGNTRNNYLLIKIAVCVYKGLVELKSIGTLVGSDGDSAKPF